MKNLESNIGIGKAMGEVSTALFELRDTLVELSLALKDWQFETDLVQRNNAEKTVRRLLQQIASTRDSSSSP